MTTNSIASAMRYVVNVRVADVSGDAYIVPLASGEFEAGFEAGAN